MATKLHTWLEEECKIDDFEERSEIVDAFVHPKCQPSTVNPRL